MASSEESAEVTRRERQTREEPFGTVREAGPEKKFVASGTNPLGTVHERPERENGDGYQLDPICGQQLPPGSIWAGIDAESAEEVAKEYHAVKFCSKCFTRSWSLEKMGREARR